MATNAYSGFLSGIRGEQEDYLALQRDERQAQQAALSNTLSTLRIEQLQNANQEFDANAGLRELTNETAIAKQEDILSKLRASDELSQLYNGIQLTDQDENPRRAFDVAQDLFRASQLSSNPVVREQGLDIFREAGARQAAEQAEVDPQAAFDQLRELNLVPPGYQARRNGNQFEIVGPGGDVTNTYPVDMAGGVVRDFALGEAKTLDAILKQKGQSANDAIKTKNAFALEELRQQGQDRRTNQSNRSAERVATANAERQGKISAEKILTSMLKARAKAAADAGETGAPNFDAAGIVNNALGRTPTTASSVVAPGPNSAPIAAVDEVVAEQAPPAPTPRSIQRSTWADVRAGNMTPSSADRLLEEHHYAILGPQLYARLKAIRDRGER